MFVVHACARPVRARADADFLVCRAARKATVERAKKDKLKRREENLKSRGKGARKGGKQVGWHGQAGSSAVAHLWRLVCGSVPVSKVLATSS